MCQPMMIPVSSSAVHNFSQAGSSSLGLTLAIINETWRTPPFLAKPHQLVDRRVSGVSGSIGAPISRSGAAWQNSSSQSL